MGGSGQAPIKTGETQATSFLNMLQRADVLKYFGDVKENNMRVENWEKRLKEVIEKHQSLPSDYAVSNCYIIPDDAVLAVTGKRMHPAMYGGGKGPKTEGGAARRLLKHGFRNVEEAFAARFERLPTVLQARRGDIGVYERNGVLSGGVFTAIGFMSRTAERVVFIPISEIKSAFKVD